MYMFSNVGPEEIIMKKLFWRVSGETLLVNFSNEEEFMRKYGYSGVDIHKTAHDNFINEVNHQIKQLSSDRKDDGARFYSYMVGWILNHIAKADRVWAAFVKPKI